MSGLIQLPYGVSGFDSMDTMDDPLALGEGMFEEEESVESENLYNQLIAARAGLKLWWKIDETSGATAADSSGNGNTGTIATTGSTLGQPPLIADGGFSLRHTINPPIAVITADNGNNIATGAQVRTVELLFKFTDPVPGTQTLWGMGNRGIVGNALLAQPAGSNLLHIATGPTTGFKTYSVTHDLLTHIATVRLDGTTVNDLDLFIDGVLLVPNSTTGGANTLNTAATPLILGSIGIDISPQGFYDHFSVCDTAISNADILAAHAAAGF